MTKPGFRFKCVAASYSLGAQHKFMRGQVFDLPADDPLVATLKPSPAFDVTNIELPDDSPAPVQEPASEGDKEPVEPTGQPVDLEEVPELKEAHLNALMAAGYNTTADVREAGADKLIELDGIGEKTAGEIIRLCTDAQEPASE